MTEISSIFGDIHIKIFCSLLAIIFLRTFFILRNTSFRKSRITKRNQWHLVVVLGSGGHSTEMQSLLRDVDPTRFIHRTYIASSGDDFAIEKAFQIETVIQSKLRPFGPSNARTWDSITGTWDVKIVPRARKVYQSLFTTPFSSMWCYLECIRAFYWIEKHSKAAPNEFPDIIVSNGPATGVIVICAANLMRFIGLAPTWKMKVIYVESWARVKSLSLSGRLLLKLRLCDRFLVQWETLARKLNEESTQKVEWKGILVE